MGASHNGQTLAVEQLLAGGANVNLQNKVCQWYLGTIFAQIYGTAKNNHIGDHSTLIRMLLPYMFE